MTLLASAIDTALRNTLLAQDVPVTERAVEALVTAALGALDDAALMLSSEAHHRIMRMAGSAHDCPVDGCCLSAEEHHRIAYGILAENIELKRRVTALENGRVEV